MLGQFRRSIIESMRALYPDFVFRSICIVMEDINTLCASTVVNKMILRECVQSHFLCVLIKSLIIRRSYFYEENKDTIGSIFEGIYHITSSSVQLPSRDCVFLSNTPVSDNGVECFELSTGQYLIDAAACPGRSYRWEM